MNLKLWLLYVALIGVVSILSWFMSPVLGFDFKLVTLAGMVVCYVVLSLWVEVARRRLWKDTKHMALDDQAAFLEEFPDIRLGKPTRKGRPSPRITTLVGACTVCFPSFLLLLAPLLVLSEIFDVRNYVGSGKAAMLFLASLLFGLVLAWTWWSLGATVWRWWATMHRGMSPEEVQLRGEDSNILCAKDSFFTRTELGHLLRRGKT
jgi:hypothetical protein